MVVHAFPAAKLGALLIRQISRPIANAIKHHAKGHPLFRRYFCMPPAIIFNWCDVKLKMWLMNAGRPTTIPSLSDAMVIELGANILGEIIIFLIAAIVITMEVSRQKHKEEKKERLRREELDKLKNELVNIMKELKEHENEITRLTVIIDELENGKKAKNVSYTASPKWDTRSILPSAENHSVSAAFPNATEPSFIISVKSSSLSCAKTHNIPMSTDYARTNVGLSPSRKFCDFGAMHKRFLDDRSSFMKSDHFLINTLGPIARYLVYRQNDNHLENKGEFVHAIWKNKD